MDVLITKHPMTTLYKLDFFCRVSPPSLSLSSVVSPMLRRQIRQYDYVLASLATLRIVSPLEKSSNFYSKNGLRASYVGSVVDRLKQKRPCIGPGR